MRAISGYLEDGRFTPLDGAALPRRLPVIMVFSEGDEEKSPAEQRQEQAAAWLKRLHKAIDASVDEDLPDLPPRSPACPPLYFEG